MYTVVIREMSKAESPEDEWVAGEFATLDVAKEFARRWVRDSLEELRAPDQSAQELYKQWMLFGDDAVVEGSGFLASSELDMFIATPATPEQRAWKALKDSAKIWQHEQLPVESPQYETRTFDSIIINSAADPTYTEAGSFDVIV